MRGSRSNGERFQPLKVLEIDLARAFEDAAAPAGHSRAFVLVRWNGSPVGTLELPYVDGRITRQQVSRALEAEQCMGRRLLHMRLRARLLGDATGAADPLPTPTVATGAADPLPAATVAICTRDRPHDLRRCLESLVAARPSNCEILVVDNDPPDDATRRVAEDFRVRYAREPHRGLNAARRLATRLASGDVIAFTDDDVVVDEDWIRAILRAFSAPRVGAATGLTLALELETRPQYIFERVYGGHGRGFEPLLVDYTEIAPCAAGRLGSGANMAFRRELAADLDIFGLDLDVGTCTLSGGDTYALYRVLAAGYRVAYNPEALVWHRHRPDYDGLRRTLHGYNVGGFSFLLRCWLTHGDWKAPRVAASWLAHYHAREFWRSILRRPRSLPVDLMLAQLRGVLASPLAYARSRTRGSDDPGSRSAEAVGDRV
jgi:glycosyltransferase involved in cell wall biosynthesis